MLLLKFPFSYGSRRVRRILWFLINISFVMYQKYAVLPAAQEQQIPYEEKDEISKSHEMVN